MKIILVKKASGQNYSIEAGLHDGVRNFDHHGDHSDQPCPARNESIPVLKDSDTVEITHMDADTYLGLRRMAGRPIPYYINLELLEQIDLNGSSVCPDNGNETLAYMIGVGQLARDLKFPYPTDEPQNVTRKVYQIMLNEDNLIDFGLEAIKRSEQAYKDCLVSKDESGIAFLQQSSQ